MNIPLSGLRHNDNRLAASAHNTANTSTEGFSAQSVRASEAPSGGVRSAVEALPHPSGDLPPGNKVNQVEEAVNRISAVRSFEANVNVVRGQDSLAKSLLDLTA